MSGTCLSSLVSHDKRGGKLACLGANKKAIEGLGNDQEPVNKLTMEVGKAKELLHTLVPFRLGPVGDA